MPMALMLGYNAYAPHQTITLSDELRPRSGSRPMNQRAGTARQA
jgi:hypothetical protein